MSFRASLATVTASVAAAVGLCVALFGSPTVTITGNPSPPAHVDLYEDYTTTVQVTAPSGYCAFSASLWSKGGTENDPGEGDWGFKGLHQFSGWGQTAQHTWTNENQANGHYWWKGFGVDTEYTPNSPYGWSSPIGPYSTP